eukprot:TRINITY_DN3225_c0_g1_i1.p1 TRINITY_DN3225_c0_g1~~TRINITY_DN3225_c0_g1_i1.p1  ORF type:complete len:503 (-),score=134.42 TRINITY_DN3225_c0_g1_i1:203-1711(-)
MDKTSIPKELLADPSYRIVKEVRPPIGEILPQQKVFDSVTKKPIPENLKPHFLREGKIEKADALRIISLVSPVFEKEPNVLTVADPVTVCGDVHGQYYDLMKLLEIGGDPSNSSYLFLGDYVDRGCFSCEVCLLLFSYKILYPTTFFMLRGNHECRHLTNYFNFKKECLYKYDEEVYNAFMKCFDHLPLAAILNHRFLCIHGGISPDILTIDEIRMINRHRETPSSGPMCDLLWSDPSEDDDLPLDSHFMPNELRGCSYVYTSEAVKMFLRTNNLLSIIRAHEAQDEGYRLYRKLDTTDFPSVICIFSAPNYCDTYGNKGAVIRFQNNLMNIRQFNDAPHPYHLPNFMNVFNWSLPFVAEKLVDMLHAILSRCGIDESEMEEEPSLKVRGEKIRAKILTIAKLNRMLGTLRKESESIVELKGLAGGTLPRGLLVSGSEAIRAAVGDFREAKLIDAVNEKRPPMEGDAVASPEGRQMKKSGGSLSPEEDVEVPRHEIPSIRKE